MPQTQHLGHLESSQRDDQSGLPEYNISLYENYQRFHLPEACSKASGFLFDYFYSVYQPIQRIQERLMAFVS